VRRQLNIRVLLIALAVLLGFAALFHGLHVWQFDRNVASLLAYAREAKKEKKIDQSLNLYEQYLKHVPKDFDVQEEYVLALEGVSQSAQDRNHVVSLLEGLLLKSSARPTARWRLVENLILLSRYEAAVRHLDILRPAHADRAEIEHKRGWCLDAAGKAEAAAEAYRKAVEIDPKRIDSALLLAEVLHHSLSRDVEAQEVLDKMVAANPTSAQAHLARFRYERMLGRDAEAAKDLAAARKLEPTGADVLLAACQWAQAKGNDAEARELVAEGYKLYPDNEAMIKERAGLELRQGRPDLALKVIEDGLKALHNKTRTGELQVFHADMLIDAGKTKEAASIIAQLRQEGLAPALPNFLQARLLIHDKKWGQAQALLEKTRPSLGSDPYWNGRINALIGFCFGQLGDGDRQIAALLDAARSEPRWAALNLSLGQAFLEADNPEQAFLYLQPLVDDPEAPPGAYALLARARFRLALQLPERERPWKDLHDAVALAEKHDPGSLYVALLRADVLQAQHRIDAARTILLRETKKRSIQTLPDDLPAWLALADLETRNGEFDRADALLQETEMRFGDRAAVRLGKAKMFVERGRADDRTTLKALAENASDWSAEERGRLRLDLAEMWLRQGDNATARDLLVRAGADLPRDFRSRSLLLDLDLQDSKVDDARKWLIEIQALEGPSGKQAAFAALFVRVEEAFGRPDALRKLLTELKDSPLRRGDNGRVDLVETRIYERLGDADRARDKLLDAVVAGQRSPRVLQRLVRVLTERREYEKLAWAVSLIEGRGPMPREIGRASIEAALATKSVEQARDLLGPINLDAIRDYRELLWLAHIYKAMNDPALTERSLRRAVAVAPHAPDAWISLATHLVGAGKRPQANDLIADIDRKAPLKSRPIIRARVWQAIGNVKDAESAYLAAMKGRPNDFLVLLAAADFYRQSERPALAEPIYKKILDPTLATPSEIASRARRGLALALAASSPANAALVLEGNRPRKEVVDERLTSYLSGLDPARRDAALRDFEASLTRGPASSEESYWLVQLLDAAGQADAAKARMDALVADDKDTPEMLAFYGRSLLRQKKNAEARTIIERLLEREPDSPRSRELHAQLAAAKK
jgi:predicted Zn-dependent protease